MKTQPVEKSNVERIENGAASEEEEQQPLGFDKLATKRLVRKIDWVLLPFLSLLYLLSFLDRTNIGNAKLARLEEDLHMKGLMYNLALVAFFPTYALAEIPSNIMMKRLRPSVWISSIMVAWGVVCILMGLVKNFAGLVVARAFLGLTEGGLFPGIAFYITMWYKRHECGLRIAIFFSAATAAGAFGGLLARAIVTLDGKLGHPGWAWIFFIEGTLTLAVAIISFWAMQDWPETAKFLKEDERREVKRRLVEDQDSLATEYDRKYVWQSLLDWKVYAFSAMGAGLALPIYSVSLFLPTIVKSLGYTNTSAQLMTVPPYTVACGWVADRTRQRGIIIMGFSVLAMVGFTMLIVATNPNVKYAACFFVTCGLYPCSPQGVAWLGNNIGGASKRAIAIATFVMLGNLVAPASSFIYLPSMAPHYRTGHSILLGSVGVTCAAACALSIHFRRENARREKIKPAASYSQEEKLEDRELGDYARFFRYTV